MSLDFPENMREVQEKLAIERIDHPELTEESVIQTAVVEIFQIYLNMAEDGHYDTAKLEGNDFVIYDLANQPIAKVMPLGDSFIADYRENTDRLLTYLEEQAYQIAKL